MMLIPVERMKTLTHVSKPSSPNQENVLPSVVKTSIHEDVPDIKLKKIRQKRIHTAKSRTLPTKKTVSLSLDSFMEKPRYITSKISRAKQLLAHLKNNEDRIKYDNGELQFDGITSGDTNIQDLVSAVISDGNPSKTPGWEDMVRALKATDAHPSIYGKWKADNKKSGWRPMWH